MWKEGENKDKRVKIYHIVRKVLYILNKYLNDGVTPTCNTFSDGLDDWNTIEIVGLD